jgi:hypothetical protein
MHVRFKRVPVALILTAVLAGTFGSGFARADDSMDGTPDQGAQPPAVARIAAIDGQVGIKHGDGGEESAAAVNAPLLAGDYLSTGDDGRVEIQLDANTIIRAGADTQLRFTALDGQGDIAQIAQGRVELRVLQSDPDQVQVETPSVDVQPSQAGAYLIAVENDGDSQITARSGSLSVVTPNGTQEVDPGRTLLATGSASDPQYRYVDEVAMTGVEQWGDERDQQLLADAGAAPYDQGASGAPDDSAIPGIADLNQNGDWVDIPGYGNAWVPNEDQTPGWTPYSNGEWVSEPYYGYTWVAAEPWGWAPYHYGRWCYASSYGWAWVPGPIVRPAWSPALVAFFGFGGPGVRVGLGYGNVGWVPLAPGEVYHPWYGYGGSSITFNLSFNNYRNYDRGFIGVPYRTWQRGVIRNVHPLSRVALTRTTFYRGTLAVRPSAGFNARFSYRSLNTARFQTQRFTAMRAPATFRAATYARPATTWQRFSQQNRSYAPARTFAPARNYAPARSYAPSYARSYAQPRSYAPSYARSYTQPRSYGPRYQRSYVQPRSYAPRYTRSYAQPRAYQPSASYGYRAPARPSYQRGYAPPRQSAPRGYAPRQFAPRQSAARQPHGPGRP